MPKINTPDDVLGHWRYPKPQVWTKPQKREPKLFSRKQAAEYLGLSLWQFDEIKNQINCKRKGKGHRRWTVKDLDNWLASDRIEPAEPVIIMPSKKKPKPIKSKSRPPLPTDEWLGGRPDD